MHRIKALFRRRSYDESSPVLPERNKARLSHTRRSFDSHRGQRNTKNDHATDPNSSRHKENLVERKTDGFKSPDSHHPTNASSPVASQLEPRASTERAPGRQRSVLVKRPRKSLSRKEMPGHFYSDNRASTEERPKTSPAEIRHRKDSKPIPPTRHQDRAVKVINKDDSTTSSGELSSSEAGKNVIDLRDTVDTDETVTYAPTVTHETVRPHVHEILEEQIYREIHNHDVYHRIQPVYDIEILPARHFVPRPDGRLIEVPEDAIPECTGVNQKWHVSKEAPPAPPSLPAPSLAAPPLPTSRQPETVAEDNAVREPIKENVEEEEQGNLEPIKTCTTIDDRDFKDVYSESWQSCAARIF